MNPLDADGSGNDAAVGRDAKNTDANRAGDERYFSRIRRRDFLGAAAAALALGATHLGARRRRDPPNVLFILTDQFRGDALGAAGNLPVHTPNLDRLARQGVRFSHAYCAQALCTPARATLLTGMYPHKHGLMGNVYNVPTVIGDPRYRLSENFPVLLKRAGYVTGYVGKWHLGEENPGFFDYWKGFNSLLQPWLGERQKSPYRSDVETDDGLRFLEQNRGRRFLLYQSYYPPHTPYTAPEKFYRYYEGKSLQPMEYYAAISAVDWNVGRLLDGLERLGLTDNTLVVFTSDHGETFGRRAFSKHKGVCYEESAHIPLLMRHSTLLPHGKVWNAGVSSVDLMPTILSATGLPVPPGVQGQNLLDVVRRGRDRWEHPVFLQNIGEGQAVIERAVRTGRWKLILRGLQAEPQWRMDDLYDLTRDPGETTNRFAESPATVTDLSRSLVNWGRQYDDEVAIRFASRYA
jgi:choline-sulfatase